MFSVPAPFANVANHVQPSTSKFPTNNRSKMVSSRSPCSRTNVQTQTIRNVPSDVPYMPNSFCLSMCFTYRVVSYCSSPSKPLAVDDTSKMFSILLKARSRLGKISSLRHFVEIILRHHLRHRNVVDGRHP